MKETWVPMVFGIFIPTWNGKFVGKYTSPMDGCVLFFGVNLQFGGDMLVTFFYDLNLGNVVGIILESWLGNSKVDTAVFPGSRKTIFVEGLFP